MEGKLVVMVPESEAVGFEECHFPGTSTYLQWQMVTKHHLAVTAFSFLGRKNPERQQERQP
jgi:hypothetical protein